MHASKHAGVVLLIEDDGAANVVIAAHLRQKGFTTLQANSPNNALALWHRHGDGINFVLSDYDLKAEKNGYDLLREFCSASQTLRCILFSGKLLDFEIETDLSDRIKFLPKPFQLWEIDLMLTSFGT